MEHIQAIQEVGAHTDEMPVHVVASVKEERLSASSLDQDSGDEDDNYPDVTEIDPPAGMTCQDFNNEEVVLGDMVRNRWTGTIMKVESIVYEGFEDRRLANDFAEPGFMLSPNECGMDCVNAGECEKIDM